MKALIYCQESLAENLPLPLRTPHAYLLPFLNKPLLTHWLESLYLLGVREVRIVSQRTWLLQSALGDGQALGLKLSFQAGDEQDIPAQVWAKNQGFLQEEPVLWVSGYGLLLPPESPLCLRMSGHRPLDLTPRSAPVQVRWLPGGSVPGISTSEAVSIGPQLHSEALTKVHAYYLCQLGLLANHTEIVTLPAYGACQEGHVGTHLQKHETANISGNSLIGDRCYLAAHSGVAHSVLGPDVEVSEYTQLQGCIVLGNSWIGPHLKLSGKIIAGTTVIDPVSGETLDFAEADFFAAWHRSRQVVPWWHRLMAIGLYASGRLAAKRPLLRQVMQGKRRLIDAASVDLEAGQMDVITYADALGHSDPLQRHLDNLYYQQQVGWRNDLHICWLWLTGGASTHSPSQLSILSPTAPGVTAYHRSVPKYEFQPGPAALSRLP
jgi:hypothetical protein